MAHEVFISYSSKDKPIADGICANLESAGIRCWIAPRDIGPGEDWPTAIANAISASQIMVLVFSSHSNSSEDVGRELFLAANSKLIIIPFKIEDVQPVPGKNYYLARTHWLDAMNPPTREQISLLIDRLNSLLHVPMKRDMDSSSDETGSKKPAPVIEDQPRRKFALQPYIWIPGLIILLGLSSWFGFDTLRRRAVISTRPTLTWTPVHTVTPAATKIASTNTPLGMVRIDIKDPFTMNANNWPEMNDYNDGNSNQTLTIQDGHLNYGVDCKLSEGCYYIYNPGIPQTSDLNFSVDVGRAPNDIHATGYYGIVFRFLDGSNYYAFFIDDSNSTFLIWKVKGGVSADVVGWTGNGAIATDKPNHLEVSGQGSSFTFTINGTLVTIVNIEGIPSGYVGIAVGTEGASRFNVLYDNFNLSGTAEK